MVFRLSVVVVGIALVGCSDTEDAGGTTTTADVPVTPVECLTDSECEVKLPPGVCQVARCLDGTCETPALPAGSVCESEGLELGECQVGRCDGAGACTPAAAANGQPCGFSDACNRQACSAGTCVDAEPTVCWDGNPCTDDGCDPASGCLFTDNTAACEDGNPCTAGDVCADGFCVSGENDCDCFEDADCATVEDDLCDGPLVCVENKCVNDDTGAVTCTPPAGLGQCETYLCNPDSGQCEVTINVEADCDDGNACTVGDYCVQNGNCLPGNTVECEFDCGDLVDDDDDGATDCADTDDCSASPACE